MKINLNNSEFEVKAHGLYMERTRKRIMVTRRERGTFEKNRQNQKLPSIKGHKHDIKHKESIARIESQDP